jgi:hypothetical protein
LSGIDLSNHKGVVIIDFIPDGDGDASASNSGVSTKATLSAANVDEFNSNSADEENENDGFLQVMTKKGKKAEKLKAAQAAAAAAAAAQAAIVSNAKLAHNNNKKASNNFSSSIRKDSNNNLLSAKISSTAQISNTSKQLQTPTAQHQKSNQKSNDLMYKIEKAPINNNNNNNNTNAATTIINTNAASNVLPVSTSPLNSEVVTVNLNKSNSASIMTNIQTWKNEMASPDASSSNSPGSANKQGETFFSFRLFFFFLFINRKMFFFKSLIDSQQQEWPFDEQRKFRWSIVTKY